MNEVQGVGETQQFGIYLCEFWAFLEFLLHFCKALSAMALFIYKSNGCVGLYSCSLRLCAVISRCFPWGIICLHTRCPGMKSHLFHIWASSFYESSSTYSWRASRKPKVLEVFCWLRLLKRWVCVHAAVCIRLLQLCLCTWDMAKYLFNGSNCVERTEAGSRARICAIGFLSVLILIFYWYSDYIWF